MLRVKDNVEARAIIRTNNETGCTEECKKDAICSVFTFQRNQTDAAVKNCFLYSMESLLCEPGDCVLLQRNTSYMTQFNYW